jgi:hypothetical protein
VYNPYLTERLLEYGQCLAAASESASLALQTPPSDSQQGTVQPAVQSVFFQFSCGLFVFCGLEEGLDAPAKQDAEAVPEGVPDSFDHVFWVQSNLEKCAWAASLARSRISCAVKKVQFQATLPTEAGASPLVNPWQVQSDAIADIEFKCSRLVAPVSIGASEGQLEITTTVQCTKQQDYGGQVHMSCGDVVVSRHGCNSTIRVDLGVITVAENLLKSCDGDWTEAKIRELYEAEQLYPIDATISGVHVGFLGAGSAAYQQFCTLPIISCPTFPHSRRVDISMRPSSSSGSKDASVSTPTPAAVHVSAALCEALVALLGESAGSFSIQNNTEFEFQVLQNGKQPAQLVTSGVHVIRSSDATQEFSLQIPGCEPSQMIRVSKGVADLGQPILVPGPWAELFVRIDVSGTVVSVQPAFAVTNHLPESVSLSMTGPHCKEHPPSVDILPGSTGGAYSCLGGKFPITVDSLRAECHTERRDAYKTTGSFTIQFVRDQEFEVKLLNEASGRVTMKVVLVFTTPYAVTIFSRFWLVNRMKLPMEIRCSDKWGDECWPSAQSPGAVYTLSVGSASDIRLRCTATGKFHEINLKRLGSGSLPVQIQGGDMLDYSIDAAPAPFSRTTVLTIGRIDRRIFEPLGQCANQWSVRLVAPSLSVSFSDMGSAMLCHWPQFPSQHEALLGDLFSVSLRNLRLECNIGSDEHAATSTILRRLRIGAIEVQDLVQAQLRPPGSKPGKPAITVAGLELSGRVEQRPQTASDPCPPLMLSISAALGKISVSVDDAFLLKLMATTDICNMYKAELDGLALSGGGSGFFSQLRERQSLRETPDVQLVVTELKVSGSEANGDGAREIPVRVDFSRRTNWVLPQVRELSKVPKGDYGGSGWAVPAFTLRNFAGNQVGLQQRVAQAAQDELFSSWFSLVFGQVLPRLDQAVAVVAANALEAAGAGVIGAVNAVGDAPSKALEAGRLARGGRLDDGYHVGDLTAGILAETGGHAGAVGSAIGGAGTLAVVGVATVRALQNNRSSTPKPIVHPASKALG